MKKLQHFTIRSGTNATYMRVLACFGNPDPVDMKVYCPEGEETFNDDETTEEAPT
jgi:hypothetical protein